MNIYSVYTDSSKKDNELILIKQGFSLIAGFFNFFWALYHRMWAIAIFLMILSFIVSADGLSFIAYSISLAILFIFGFFASEIREYYAIKRGYSLSDIILAYSEEEAEIKYIQRIKALKNL